MVHMKGGKGVTFSLPHLLTARIPVASESGTTSEAPIPIEDTLRLQLPLAPIDREGLIAEGELGRMLVDFILTEEHPCPFEPKESLAVDEISSDS